MIITELFLLKAVGLLTPSRINLNDCSFINFYSLICCITALLYYHHYEMKSPLWSIEQISLVQMISISFKIFAR